MGARNAMIHRTQVERKGVPDDEYTPTSTDVWAPLGAPIACLYWQRAEREVMVDKSAIVSDARMMVPRGTDVTERDRINGVTDRRGQVIRAGVMAVAAVIPRRDHLELALSAATA